MNACKHIRLRAHPVERGRMRLIDMRATRASKRRNIDRCRSGLYEGLCSGASGSAGSENVVNKQNVFPTNGNWIGNVEGATYIETALAWREAGLTFGSTETHERAGREHEAPLGI